MPRISRNDAASVAGDPVTKDYRPSAVGLPGWMGIGVRTFSLEKVELMRYDSTVAIGTAMIETPVIRHEGQWQVNADSPEIQKFVEKTLKRFWQQSIRSVVTNCRYGYAAGEPIWKLDRNGMLQYQRLKPLLQRDVVPGRDPATGELGGLLVKSGLASGPMQLLGAEGPKPAKGFWVYYGSEFNNWYGESRYISAFPPWQEKTCKDGTLDIIRMWYYKNAYRGMTIRHPEKNIRTASGYIPARDMAIQIAEVLKCGGVAALPSTVDPKTGQKDWDIDHPAINGNAEGLLEYLNHQDGQILRGLKIPDDVVTGVSAGYAGRKVSEDAFYTMEEELLHSIAGPLDDQIIAPSVWYNFGPGDKYEIVYSPMLPARQQLDAMQQNGAAAKGGGNPDAAPTPLLDALSKAGGPGTSQEPGQQFGQESGPGGTEPITLSLGDREVQEGQDDLGVIIRLSNEPYDLDVRQGKDQQFRVFNKASKAVSPAFKTQEEAHSHLWGIQAGHNSPILPPRDMGHKYLGTNQDGHHFYDEESKTVYRNDPSGKSEDVASGQAVQKYLDPSHKKYAFGDHSKMAESRLAKLKDHPSLPKDLKAGTPQHGLVPKKSEPEEQEKKPTIQERVQEATASKEKDAKKNLEKQVQEELVAGGMSKEDVENLGKRRDPEDIKKAKEILEGPSGTSQAQTPSVETKAKSVAGIRNVPTPNAVTPGVQPEVKAPPEAVGSQQPDVASLDEGVGSEQPKVQAPQDAAGSQQPNVPPVQAPGQQQQGSQQPDSPPGDEFKPEDHEFLGEHEGEKFYKGNDGKVYRSAGDNGIVLEHDAGSKEAKDWIDYFGTSGQNKGSQQGTQQQQGAQQGSQQGTQQQGSSPGPKPKTAREKADRLEELLGQAASGPYGAGVMEEAEHEELVDLLGMPKGFQYVGTKDVGPQRTHMLRDALGHEYMLDESTGKVKFGDREMDPKDMVRIYEDGKYHGRVHDETLDKFFANDPANPITDHERKIMASVLHLPHGFTWESATGKDRNSGLHSHTVKDAKGEKFLMHGSVLFDKAGKRYSVHDFDYYTGERLRDAVPLKAKDHIQKRYAEKIGVGDRNYTKEDYIRRREALRDVDPKLHQETVHRQADKDGVPRSIASEIADLEYKHFVHGSATDADLDRLHKLHQQADMARDAHSQFQDMMEEYGDGKLSEEERGKVKSAAEDTQKKLEAKGMSSGDIMIMAMLAMLAFGFRKGRMGGTSLVMAALGAMYMFNRNQVMAEEPPEPKRFPLAGEPWSPPPLATKRDRGPDEAPPGTPPGSDGGNPSPKPEKDPPFDDIDAWAKKAKVNPDDHKNLVSIADKMKKYGTEAAREHFTPEEDATATEVLKPYGSRYNKDLDTQFEKLFHARKKTALAPGSSGNSAATGTPPGRTAPGTPTTLGTPGSAGQKFALDPSHTEGAKENVTQQLAKTLDESPADVSEDKVKRRDSL